MILSVIALRNSVISREVDGPDVEAYDARAAVDE
jgi:hypothetical protein